MSNTALAQAMNDNGFNYHLLRQSLNRYKKNLAELNQDEFTVVETSAIRSWELENRVLASAEAQCCVISDKDVEQSVEQVFQRYQNEQEFIQDLERNGLDQNSLYQALHRELKFDAVMQLVSKDAPAINELDIRLFYEMHGNRFEIPEKRFARHILITINDAFAENIRENALRRINEIKHKLNGRINRFAKFAQRYSECPTAMEGGKLGEIQQGHLYPEIEQTLFTMQAESISDVVESEMGFHLLYCEKIVSAKKIPLNQVRDQIETLLNQRQVRNCQKNWIKQISSDRQDDD